jgi:hypothetical protein
MPRFITPWERAHSNQQEGPQYDATVFEKNPAKFAAVVNREALSNADKQAEALSQADSYSFQVAHPEFRQTDKNIRLVNHWLTSQGITNPLFPDMAAAVDALTAEGLLDIDKTAKAPSTFKGALTGQVYDSLDSMIAQERKASLSRVPAQTDEEIAFENMPVEEMQARIKGAMHQEQLKANGLQTQKQADAWVTLNPWFVDSQHNARLIKMQLAANGASDNNASIADFDTAAAQLRDSGLLTVNKTAVAKQHATEVAQIADAHKEIAFDEAEAYDLPLEEVRRRAMLQNR